MADTQGQADIRGIHVQKFLTGFADEDSVLIKFARQSSSPTREFRWFQKTPGYVSPTTTTGITANLAVNTASRALFPVANQSFTRNTGYIRKYAMESELISIEDEKDASVDVLGITLRDLLKGIGNQIDTRIYNVLTEDLSVVNITTVAAVADGWDDLATGDPIYDIMAGMQLIRAQRYNPHGGVLYINSIEHRNLLRYLISVKGSSIPQFASQKIETGVVMEILGLKVVVSENATTDYAVIFIPQVSVAWTSFMPITSEVERLPGKGKKVYCWQEGEATLENPKSVCLITDTVV